MFSSNKSNFHIQKKVLNMQRKNGVSRPKLNNLGSRLVGVPQTKNSNIARPSQPILNTLSELYQTGRYTDAEKLAVSITKEFPEHQFSWKVLGAIFWQTGRKVDALNANQKAVKLAAQDAGAHNNLGVTLQALGKLDEAQIAYRRAIRLKPDYAEANNNLGALMKALGRLDQAEVSYRQAIKLKPDYVEALNNLGNVLKEQGRLDSAEASFMQAIKLKSNFSEAYNNLGVTLHALDRVEEAEAAYRQAIALKADYSDAYLNLCELLEGNNKLDKTSLVIKSAAGKVFDKDADFLFYQALISFRQENYEIVESIIVKIKIDELSKNRKASFLKLKADWYHYIKNYSSAFEAFKFMNETVKDSLEYKQQVPDEYFRQQTKKVFQIRKLQEKSSYKIKAQAGWLQPTFLIGFPRSGTTLLDTILRTHSKIHVVEEKLMVGKMGSKLGHFPTISAIEKIDNALVEILRGIYLEELKKHSQVVKNQITIDKLPLNILEIPLINKIFPKANFILALRHPLDCIMSCWMQNFRMNSAMANMVDLDRIVDLYCTAMEVLDLCQKRYELNIHRVRYENLVIDFREEVSSVLTFLNLNWEEELTNYQRTAVSRGKINTPSYSQVVKPIYNTAAYRWKNYEEYLESYKSRLEPWLNEHGYLD